MLRFFAALSVVLFHLNQSTIVVHNWYRNVINCGWLGVPVFFVISGYCIALSADHSSDIKSFLAKRFFRIFPPYWFSLVVVGLAACFQKLYTGSNAVANLPHNFISLLATLTLTTSPLSAIKTINWVYWSLTFELFFYLILWISLIFAKQYRIYFLLAVSMIALIMPQQHTGILVFLDQWPTFGCGICVYYYFKSVDKVSWVCFSLLLIINSSGLYVKFGENIIYIIAAMVTVIIIFVSHFIDIQKNIFSKLGEISYSVYLLHVPVGVFIISLFENAYIQKNPFANMAYDIGVYSVLTALAWLMFKFIEQQGIVYGHKISGKDIIINFKKQNT